MNKETILEKLETVKHPAIDLSLIKLGILQNIELENNTLKATLAWPFDLVPLPVKQMIITSIENTLKPFNINFKYKEKIMNENEREKFLKLEKENWKGF